MPPLGEVPITSYFHRNPTSKKRKGKTGSTPPLKKQKSGETHAPKDASNSKVRRSNVKEKEREIFSIMTAGTRVNEGPHRTRSAQRALIPNTPSMMDKEGGGDALDQLKTPSTNEALFPPTASGSILSQTIPKSRVRQIDQKSVSFLPTPVTMRRQGSRHLLVSSFHDEETPSKLTNGSEITTPILSDFEDEDRHVHSSQRQHSLDLSPKAPSLSTRSTFLAKETSYTKPLPHKRHSAFASSQTEEHDLKILDERDAQLVIASSQTQLLDALANSPQRTRMIRGSGASGRDSHLVECVPSSQSQEHELMMPPLESEMELPKKIRPTITAFLQNFTAFYPRSSPSKGKFTANKPLPRTLSDTLFPIPIQDLLLNDILQAEDKASEGPEQRSLVPSTDENPDYLSVTESESEPEAEETTTLRSGPSSGYPGTIARARHVSPSDGSPYDTLTQDDSQDRESLPSKFSPENTITESLPPAVKEFQNMFGSIDESYPPDFPMSLRS